MSWTELVNNNLIATGNVTKAAICGLDGSVWGVSQGFNILPEEIRAAVDGFSHPETLLGTGLRFNNEKYFVLRSDDERIIGKKASDGFFIYKTKQAIIISIYQGGVQPEACSTVTGGLADYFKSIGY